MTAHKWLQILPPHLRPSRIQELEEIRTRWAVPAEDFALCISSHKLTTRNLQRAIFDGLLEQYPHATVKDRLLFLARHRRTLSWLGGFSYMGLEPDTAEEEGEAMDLILATVCDGPDAIAKKFVMDESEWDVPAESDYAMAALAVTMVLEDDKVEWNANS